MMSLLFVSTTTTTLTKQKKAERTHAHTQFIQQQKAASSLWIRDYALFVSLLPLSIRHPFHSIHTFLCLASIHSPPSLSSFVPLLSIQPNSLTFPFFLTLLYIPFGAGRIHTWP